MIHAAIYDRNISALLHVQNNHDHLMLSTQQNCLSCYSLLLLVLKLTDNNFLFDSLINIVNINFEKHVSLFLIYYIDKVFADKNFDTFSTNVFQMSHLIAVLKTDAQ